MANPDITAAPIVPMVPIATEVKLQDESVWLTQRKLVNCLPPPGKRFDAPEKHLKKAS